MKTVIAATLIALAGFGVVSAQAAGDHSANPATASVHAGSDRPLIDGKVNKVDKAAGKVTLSHGPLVNLNMPAMTMVFRVSNTSWLDQMKVGDRIRFKVDNVNGVATLVHVEPAN